MLNICVLVTLLTWGIWGIIDKKALDYAKQEDVMLRLYLLTYIWVPVTFLALNHFEPGWHLNNAVMFWTALASCSYVIALLAYLKAMSVSEASFVLGVTAAYPLIFQILATVFLKEALVPLRVAGALVIGAGLFLISRTSGGSKNNGTNAAVFDKTLPADGIKNSAPDPKLFFYVIVATLTWGVYGIFDKIAVSCGSPLMVFFTKTLWDSLLFFALLFGYTVCKKKIDWKNKKAWLYCSFSELALGVGGLSYLAALSLASASYVITITGCYPLLMYLFALWLLKEQFKRSRFTGILLVVLGGTLVQCTAS